MHVFNTSFNSFFLHFTFSEQCLRADGCEQRVIHEGYRAILIQTMDGFSAEGARRKVLETEKVLLFSFSAFFHQERSF